MSRFAFTPQEIKSLRSDTPGTKNVTHFNNAGAALMPDVVGNAMIEYLQHEMLIGGYETAEKYAADIAHVYASLAKYLGCESSEIAIMENATAAWAQAFQSIPFEKGDSILTSESEYASNYIPFLQLKSHLGINIEVMPTDGNGQPDLNAVEGMIHSRIRLIAISHVPTNGGLVNPAEEIGKIAKKYGLWYLLDACQSVGQMPINVKEIGCHFLSATSRKYLRGPRGIGFLYVSKDHINQLEPVIMDLHAAEWKDKDTYLPRNDARKFENWESNLAGVVAFGKALDYMLDIGIERIWDRIQFLAGYLRDELSAVPEIKVHDLGALKCGIVSFTIANISVDTIKSQSRQAGFNVSIIHPSHTLLDMQERGLGHMIRASVHYYNTEDEIDRFVEYLREII